MTAPDQTLLLLHVSQGWMAEKELLAAVEYSRLTDYKAKVLRPLHKKRLLPRKSRKRCQCCALARAVTLSWLRV